MWKFENFVFSRLSQCTKNSDTFLKKKNSRSCTHEKAYSQADTMQRHNLAADNFMPLHMSSVECMVY